MGRKKKKMSKPWCWYPFKKERATCMLDARLVGLEVVVRRFGDSEGSAGLADDDNTNTRPICYIYNTLIDFIFSPCFIFP